MDLMITYPYNVTAAAAPLRANWVGGFSAIRQDKCPLSLDSNGDMKSPDATSGLIPASVRSVGDGTIAIEAHGAYAGAFRNISNDPSFTDAVGFSTAFWVANVIDSHVPFWTLRWTLSTLSAAEKTWYASDGGNVDTTGIVNLLRTKTSRIVAFYNNNKNLTELKSPIAYLFGVDGASDNMNSIEGPALNQVFPSTLLESVFANLTSGKAGSLAVLKDVEVLKKRIFGRRSVYARHPRDSRQQRCIAGFVRRKL